MDLSRTKTPSSPAQERSVLQGRNFPVPEAPSHPSSPTVRRYGSVSQLDISSRASSLDFQEQPSLADTRHGGYNRSLFSSDETIGVKTPLSSRESEGAASSSKIHTAIQTDQHPVPQISHETITSVPGPAGLNLHSFAEIHPQNMTASHVAAKPYVQTLVGLSSVESKKVPTATEVCAEFEKFTNAIKNHLDAILSAIDSYQSQKDESLLREKIKAQEEPFHASVSQFRAAHCKGTALAPGGNLDGICDILDAADKYIDLWQGSIDYGKEKIDALLKKRKISFSFRKKDTPLEKELGIYVELESLVRAYKNQLKSALVLYQARRHGPAWN